MNTIDSFRGEYRFLSNFYPVENLKMYGLQYRSVEHAYQAAKTLDHKERKIIRQTWNPSDAKSIGKTVTIRADWASFRLIAMEELVRRKFDNPVLKKELLSTGDAILIEGNYWNDTFWGVCNGRGTNHLGRILMKIRKSHTT